ncbi:HAD family hydrolase [Anaerovorax odorimutans]|uniref:HAD family hydrolase n=1 Tax=Anaerovorax odorimutans TaxID=109327 RepID=UPI00040817F9|nr:HAD family hydrolase [Anaerovorax odorimutans]
MKKNILVLWDIDGTLMHCGADGTTALNMTFKQLYGEENAFSKIKVGSTMDAIILDKIMEELGYNKGDLEQIKKTYIKNLKNVLSKNKQIKVLPGIWEILDYIDESDYCYNALLTSNLRIGAETKLESVGLNKYFKVGGFGDEYGEKWDAAKKAVKEAEKYFGVEFENKNIYLIGDGVYDIETSKRNNIKSIGVATGWMDYDILKSHEPDYLFKDLSDYNKIIDIFKI